MRSLRQDLLVSWTIVLRASWCITSTKTWLPRIILCDLVTTIWDSTARIGHILCRRSRLIDWWSLSLERHILFPYIYSSSDKSKSNLFIHEAFHAHMANYSRAAEHCRKADAKLVLWCQHLDMSKHSVMVTNMSVSQEVNPWQWRRWCTWHEYRNHVDLPILTRIRYRPRLEHRCRGDYW